MSKPEGPFLGAHESVAGGLHAAFERIAEAGGQALQIFTRNQRQWKAKPVTDDEAEAFTAAWKDWGHPHVFSHASYLFNLASDKKQTLDKSVAGLADEVRRCQILGIGYVVLHPGSHVGQGADAGIKLVAGNLDAVLDEAEAPDVRILLENTAGQGTSLGGSLAELGAILERCRNSGKLGVCFDTCHAHGAGYDLTSEQGYTALWKEFEAEIGLRRLKLLHLNDSPAERGSHLDRHEHIGQGKLGLEAFQRLMNDPALAHLPMVLETPKGEDKKDELAEDKKNLRVLRELIHLDCAARPSW